MGLGGEKSGIQIQIQIKIQIESLYTQKPVKAVEDIGQVEQLR